MKSSKLRSVSTPIRIINTLLFISYFAIKGFGDVHMRSGGGGEGIYSIKHFILLFAAIFLIYQGYLLKKPMIQNPFFRGLRTLIFLTFLFAFISLTRFNGSTTQAYQDMLALLMILYPAMYVFGLYQVMSRQQVFTLVRIGFVIYAIAYLIAMRGQLSIHNIMSVNFGQSYSPFENSDFAAGFIGFFIYFCAAKSSKVWVIISAIFNFLVFKRVAIVFMPIFVLASFSVPVSKKIDSRIKYVFATLLVLSTILEYFLLQPQVVANFLNHFQGIDAHFLFMGRNDMFTNLLMMNFHSHGLNSTNIAIGRTFEIESLKLLLEMGFVGVTVLSFGLWRLTEDNLFSTFVMLYFSVKFLSSSTFTSTSSPFLMMLIYLAIATRNLMMSEAQREDKLYDFDPNVSV